MAKQSQAKQSKAKERKEKEIKAAISPTAVEEGATRIRAEKKEKPVFVGLVYNYSIESATLLAVLEDWKLEVCGKLKQEASLLFQNGDDLIFFLSTSQFFYLLFCLLVQLFFNFNVD